MIAARESSRAVRMGLAAWPVAELSGLLDANDAVACCAHVPGRRAKTDALVSEILGVALGRAPERSLAPGGKPYLAASGSRVPLNFSISHSGDVLVVALSRTAEVGVDIERVRAVPEWRAIAARMFDAGACAQLLAEIACGADEDDAFIGHWCRLEATVKATGEGLFACDTRDDANYRTTDRATVRVVDLPHLPLPAGTARYRGALALRP